MFLAWRCDQGGAGGALCPQFRSGAAAFKRRQVGQRAAEPRNPRRDEMFQWKRRGLGRSGAAGGTENQEERRPGGPDGAAEGGSQPRALRAGRPCPAALAGLQLQALPAAAALPCPGPSAAIEMEMPRAWRMETLFPA